jgi:hypothetical protein
MNKFIIYGGSARSDQSWELDLLSMQWSRTLISPRPGLREHHMLVYDPSRAETWLAAGWMQPDPLEIWRYNNQSAWVNTGKLLEYPPGNGTNLMGPAACWCPPLEGIVFRGGGNWNPNTTWLLKSSDASVVDLDSDNLTGFRFNIQNHMVWCGGINKVAFFGGATSSTDPSEAQNDLLLYDPIRNQWERLLLDNPPPARQNSALAYSESRNELVIHGGRSVSNALLGDLWAINMTTFESQQLEDSPYPQKFHGGWWVDNLSAYVFEGGIGSSWNQMSNKTMAYTPLASVVLRTPVSLEVLV